MKTVMRVEGGCHCGAVRFQISVPPMVELLECNCSICAQTGFLHLIVPHADFQLLGGELDLTSYRFGTRKAEHLFCEYCGIKSFYQPRSHSEAWSINFRCLDEGHGLVARAISFDGKNWEKARAELPRED
jgi:hypothetical protein